MFCLIKTNICSSLSFLLMNSSTIYYFYNMTNSPTKFIKKFEEFLICIISQKKQHFCKTCTGEVFMGNRNF